MNNVVDRKPREQRWIWGFTLLMGTALMLRTSDLQSEFIRASRVFPPIPVVSSTACPIPAQSIAPTLRALSRDIAARFHVAESAAAGITHAAFSAARIQGIDPMLVLAVAAVESKFRARAVNPVTGATGLMQVMPRWHQDKIMEVGGDPSMLLIAPNINVGAAILAEYLDAEDGDVENALGRYLGVAGGTHYLKRVHTELVHLTRVVGAST